MNFGYFEELLEEPKDGFQCKVFFSEIFIDDNETVFQEMLFY